MEERYGVASCISGFANLVNIDHACLYSHEFAAFFALIKVEAVEHIPHHLAFHKADETSVFADIFINEVAASSRQDKDAAPFRRRPPPPAQAVAPGAQDAQPRRRLAITPAAAGRAIPSLSASPCHHLAIGLAIIAAVVASPSSSSQQNCSPPDLYRSWPSGRERLRSTASCAVRAPRRHRTGLGRLPLHGYDDRGAVIDVVAWHDGDVWRVVVDTQGLESNQNCGKLADFVPLTNYRLEWKFGIF
uniref:Uncharacterized protein n=1 Tax=Oryza brachyantha TaxID=4533 RepID=J3KZN4_ORYBR